MAFKLTLDFTGKEFKQQYIQLLAQQLPLAEIDKLKSSQITITVTGLGSNGAVADDSAIKIVANGVPVTLTDAESAAG